MHLKFISFCLLAILLLPGCSGLNPTSGGKLNYNIEIKNVNFGDKPNKSAYLFKNRLNDLLSVQNGSSLEKFYLNIAVTKSIMNYGTLQNSVNTRSIIKFTCDYTILDSNNNIIDSGNATVADSFEISTSLYSSVITEEATSDRLASTLANELKNIVNSKIIKYTHQKANVHSSH